MTVLTRNKRSWLKKRGRMDDDETRTRRLIRVSCYGNKRFWPNNKIESNRVGCILIVWNRIELHHIILWSKWWDLLCEFKNWMIDLKSCKNENMKFLHDYKKWRLNLIKIDWNCFKIGCLKNKVSESSAKSVQKRTKIAHIFI